MIQQVTAPSGTRKTQPVTITPSAARGTTHKLRISPRTGVASCSCGEWKLWGASEVSAKASGEAFRTSREETAQAPEVPQVPTPPASPAQPHPIFSLPDLDNEEDEYRYQREEKVRAMGRWIERREQEARAPFQPWDELLAGNKAGKWKTQKELAATHHKPKWSTQLKRVVISQKVMSLAEWQLCFSGWMGNRDEPASSREPKKKK
jgi:hypothetical protein